MASAATKVTPFMAGLKRWAYNVSGFNKYGLYLDDIRYINEDLEEALRRADQKKIDERNYRIIRAIQLSLQKITLPQNEWTKYEDDVNNRYLTPFLDEVIKERKEKEAWEADH